MRVLLVTGKGGVGKTTTAAATALAAAGRGMRTLVMSTDPAHSLADSFDSDLGDTPSEVGERCWATQIDPQARMESSWSEIRDYLREVLDWAGVDDLQAEELAVLPGLDEIFALGDVTEHAGSGAYDLLVVDCAPTAETIRFLSLPDVLGWYMERLFPVSRRVAKVVGPVASRLAPGLPIANDAVFGATARLHDRLADAHRLLVDPLVSSVRIVVTPEKMVVAEARRLATYLSLFGYHVDAIVANRILPDDVSDPWFDEWRSLQADQLEAIEAGFAPLPVLRAPLAPAEVVGIGRLVAFAEGLYADLDPAAVLHRGEPFTVQRTEGTGGPAHRTDGVTRRAEGDSWTMSIGLPFASRDEVDLVRLGDELVVTVGPYRRAIMLPDSLRRRPVAAASLVDGTLQVAFGPRERAR